MPVDQNCNTHVRTMGCGGWQAAMRTLALDPMLLSQFYPMGWVKGKEIMREYKLLVFATARLKGCIP